MIFRVLMIVGLAALWAMGIYAVVTLPPSVVTSWGHGGHVSYGSKYSLLILPGIGTLAFVLFNWIISSGNIQVNVPFEIPPEKMDRVQAVAAQMLEVFGSLLLIGFACIESTIFQSSSTGTLSPAFPYVIGTFVALILATVATMLVRIRQAAR